MTTLMRILATALVAHLASGSGDDDHCFGEFVADADGECVLAANGGDWDEPSAAHRSCAAHQFLCPDRTTCVDTAAEYARCATGRGEGSGLHTAALAAASCDLNGTWSCGLGSSTCQVVENSDGTSFDVTAPSSNSIWSSGHATIVGTTVNVFYQMKGNGPHGRTGVLSCGSDNAATIAWNDTTTWQQQRPLTDPLDVHIIAHTHDDTGYLSTVDEYYESNVRSILTTVTQELQKNPERKFTYVEIAFFAKWWEEQDNSTKAIFRGLVAAGQLDFSNGGWCMPDEGAPSYQDMLANMQKGLRYIQREFGQDSRPRVAWSIDPFGHSSTYGTLNAMFQFDMFVVGRIDFQEKAARFATQTMETVWRPSRSADGPSRDIFTAVLDPIQFYGYPPGFNFEGDKNAWITDANIKTKADQFAAFIKKKAAGFATNSLLVPFGSDFQFTQASINYENMDRLMAYMNAHVSTYGMRLQYSTPTYYMKTLHAKDHEWPLKVDDFETYAIGPDQFLVGFYSSRPDMKGMIRQCSSQLRAAHAALTNALLLANTSAAATKLEAGVEVAALDVQSKVLGVLQHHDAITSSQRRHVHRDYVKSLSVGQASVDASLSRVLGATLTADTPPGSTLVPALVTCPHLNESTCAVTSSPSSAVTVVVLQNPTGQTMKDVPVKLPVGSGASTVSITSGDGQTVVSQLLPAWPQAPFIHNVTRVAPSPTVAFLGNIPALGTATYFLHHGSGSGGGSRSRTPPVASVAPQVGPITLSNGIVTAKFDGTGLLASLTKGPTSVAVKQTLRYYHASDGSAGPNNPHRSAGAGGSGNYIFQPDSAETYTFTPSGAPTHVSIVQGAVVSEVRHVYVEQRIEQVFRLFNGSDTLEIEYRIGAIDISDGKGKEVLSHFATDIANGDEWATDVNGMQVDMRKRNTRATLWPANQGGPEYFNQTDPVAGNYFATNTLAYIADSANATTGMGVASQRRRFSVLIDRSEGSSSLQEGSLELMIHRRLAHGCRWGMCEANPDEGGQMEKAGLNDTLGATVVLKHWLSVDTQLADGSSPSLARSRARQLNYPPSAAFGSTASAKAWPFVSETVPLSGELPEALELTTWQLLEDGVSAILRLTHIYTKGEHPTLSKPVTVDLCVIFGGKLCARLKSAGAESFVEMTAAGDVPRATVQRLQWKVKGEAPVAPEPPPTVPLPGPSMLVTIQPADTRTFKLSVA